MKMKLKKEKPKIRKMKRVKLKIGLLVISIIAIIFLSSLLISYDQRRSPNQTEFVNNMTFENSTDLFFYYGTTKYPASVQVRNVKPEDSSIVIGLSVDPWYLGFGIIPSGGNFGKRSLILTNTQDRDTKVNFRVYGNISQMVSFSKDNFVLHSSDSITINVFCRTTGTTPEGNYTGEIDIIVKYPKYEFMYNFLNWI